MSKFRKKLSILLVVALVLTLLTPAAFAADNEVGRIAGDDRYETSALIALDKFDSAETVIIVNGEDKFGFADGLAASVLAGALNAPILLTQSGKLPDAVADAIEELGASNVIILGGTTAVSEDVEGALEDLDLEVTRLQGESRIQTAVEIAKEAGTESDTAYIVNGWANADAMVAGAAAFGNGNPILLVLTDEIPEETAQALQDLGIENIIIVGGEVVVSKEVEEELAENYNVTRIAGENRAETSAAFAEDQFDNPSGVSIVNGYSLADAVGASVFESPILYASHTGEDIDAVEDYLDELLAANPNLVIVLFGGTQVLSNALQTDIQEKVDNAVPEELGVVSVTAINLVQLEVEFNQNVEGNKEVEDADNYEFEGIKDKDETDLDIIDIDVEGSRAVLTLGKDGGDGNKDTIIAVDNQSEGILEIDEAVTGEELVFDEIEFVDMDIPQIEEVRVIGNDTVKVVFSEPINLDADDVEDEFDVELNGKSYNVDEVNGVANNYEANVKVFGKFEEGTLTLEVDNGLEDYAGFNVVAGTYEVEVVEDKEAPVVVGYKKAKTTEVTLIFNEDIELTSDADEEDFYHTNKSNHINDIDQDVEIDGNELTLKFNDDNELPEGPAIVYVASGAVQDLWDNKNNTQRVEIAIEVDEIAPEVKKVEVKDGDIVITFTEELNKKSAEDTSNYRLEDEDGDRVALRSATLNKDGDEVTLDIRDDNPEDGTYELTIRDVEDLAGNEIEEVTLEVVFGDEGAPEYPEHVYYEIKNGDLILYFEFTEGMAVEGKYSVLDLSKYDIRVGNGTWINLEDAVEDDDYDVDIDAKDGNKVVVLEIEDADDFIDGDKVKKDLQVRIGRVADDDGNLTESPSATYTYIDGKKDANDENEILPLDERAIGFRTVEAKTTTEIEVEFDGNISRFDKRDFIITDGTDKYTIDDIERIDANEIRIILDDEIPANPEAHNIILDTPDDQKDIRTENAFGAKLVADANVPVIDKIKPNVEVRDNVDTSKVWGANGPADGKDDDVESVYATYNEATKYSTVTVVLNEPLRDDVVASNIKVNNGKTISVQNGDVTSGGTNGKIVFKVNAELVKGDSVTIGGYIYDVKGNSTNGLNLEIEYKVNVITQAPTPTVVSSPEDFKNALADGNTNLKLDDDIELSTQGTYNLNVNNVTIDAQSNEIKGLGTISGDDVTITNATLADNITISGDGFTSQDNTFTGAVSVTGKNASFNTTFEDVVTVEQTATGATFNNVTFNGGELVAKTNVTVDDFVIEVPSGTATYDGSKVEFEMDDVSQWHVIAVDAEANGITDLSELENVTYTASGGTQVPYASIRITIDGVQYFIVDRSQNESASNYGWGLHDGSDWVIAGESDLSLKNLITQIYNDNSNDTILVESIGVGIGEFVGSTSDTYTVNEIEVKYDDKDIVLF